MSRRLAGALLFAGAVLAARAGSAQPLTFSRIDYASDTGTRGIAVADFNRDGWPDVATANTGKGDGTFAAPVHVSAPGNPRGLAVGDVNGDGLADLVYTSYALNTVTVLVGKGTTSFTGASSYVTGVAPQGVVIAQLNQDARADLAVANTGASKLTVLYGAASGFTRVDVPSSVPLNAIAAGYASHGGYIDLAGVSTAANAIVVFENSPGRFAATALRPTTVLRCGTRTRTPAKSPRRLLRRRTMWISISIRIPPRCTSSGFG